MPIRMLSGVDGRTRRVDNTPSLTVITDRIDLACRQMRVYGYGPSVQTRDCQQNSRKFPAVLTDDHHPIAGSHSGTAEPIRSPRNNSLQLPIRPAAGWINNSLMIGQTVRPRSYNIGNAHGNLKAYRILGA